MTASGERPLIELYTDGACRGNPGPGGWGVLLRHGEEERTLKGGEFQTTNNRMEMMAAIAGLESLPPSSRVRLVTDSTYLKNGLNDWLPKWKRNG